jgi:LAGLIDADG endonuclease
LSGFIDAAGCFNTHFSNNSNGNFLSLRFFIDQKHEDPFFITLQKMFIGGIAHPVSDPHDPSRFCISVDFSLQFSSQQPITPEKKALVSKLLFYLERFPLKTKKNINFVRFQKI